MKVKSYFDITLSNACVSVSTARFMLGLVRFVIDSEGNMCN